MRSPNSKDRIYSLAIMVVGLIVCVGLYILQVGSWGLVGIFFGWLPALLIGYVVVYVLLALYHRRTLD